MSNVRTIELNEQTVKVLNELREQTKAPQEKIKEINTTFSNIITGICLSNSIDLKTEKLEISEDMSKLIISPNEKEEVNEENSDDIKEPPLKSKIRKLK